MSQVCPNCFNPTEDVLCSHCGTDIQFVIKVRMLEHLANERNTLITLREILGKYHAMQRPAAVGRVLYKLARYCLRTGAWREAQSYLEQIIALGDVSGSASFRQQVRLELGSLLGRTGEVPLALHLMGGQDERALVRRLRLEMDTRNKPHLMQILAEIERNEGIGVEAKAWRLEALSRFGQLPSDIEMNSTLKEAYDSDHKLAFAVAHRALGVWQSKQGLAENAINHLNKAQMGFMKLGDPYETARTHVDLARAYLLMGEDDNPVKNAQKHINVAIATFRKLGTPTDGSDVAFGTSLSLGTKGPPPLNYDATSATVALLWVQMDGLWGEDTWTQLQALIGRQGGIAERLPEGLLVLFGAAQHQGNMAIVIETILAMADLLTHHNKYFKVSADSNFRIVAGMGMVPHDEIDLLSTMRGLPESKLFKNLRRHCQQVKSGGAQVNDMLYLSTLDGYQYEDHRSDPEDLHSQPRWWALAMPQQVPTKPPKRRRHEMRGYDRAFQDVDSILDKFKHRNLGGVFALTGLAGSGKSEILNIISHEVQKTTGAWVIHLKGREATLHEPFGAIRHWLGADLNQPDAAPNEQRLSHIATFRRSLLGLLNSKRLLLLVDDIDRLDSGSLATLRAVLPLTASHALLMVISARPGQTDQPDNGWRQLLHAAKRAIPDRTNSTFIPPEKAFHAALLPDDYTSRHVLACAAVLGDSFSRVALRQMSNQAILEPVLRGLQDEGILQISEKWGVWRFVNTAYRDAIYEGLNPEYRAILHWYARQALKQLRLPNDEHVYHAGLPDAAMRVSVRRAAAALGMDAHREALLFMDRALTFYQGEDHPVEFQLSRISLLLNIGRWTDAQNVINVLLALPQISDRDRATLLIFQGELNYRVGEYASLSELYEKAAQALKSLPPDETHPEELISLQYAMALARFKRGEEEIARSLIGGALLKASQNSIEQNLAHLWELLAQIHEARGEYGQALKTLDKAIHAHRANHDQWGLMEPLARYGEISLTSGNLPKARQTLVDALDLAEATGDSDMIIRLHTLLGTLATYKGEFGRTTHHLKSALDVARFSEDAGLAVKARAIYAEGLALEGRMVEGFQQATLALQLAEQDINKAALGYAELSLARVSIAAAALQEAHKALQIALTYAERAADNDLLQRIYVSKMELAIIEEDNASFMHAWNELKALPASLLDPFNKGSMHLHVGDFHALGRDWNAAAREYETASRTFRGMGANHWQGVARQKLGVIAPNAPGYRRKTRPNLRSDALGNAKEGSDHKRDTESDAPQS